MTNEESQEKVQIKKSIYALNRPIKTINKFLSDDDLMIKKNILVNEINKLNIERKDLLSKGKKTRAIDIIITDKKISLENVIKTIEKRFEILL